MAKRDTMIAIVLFLGIYLFSGVSRIGTSFDSRWTVYIAESIWNHHDTNLDEYPAVLEATKFYALECVDAAGHVRTYGPLECNGHWYDSYPIGGTLLTTPLIIAAVDTMRALHPLIGRLHSSQPVIEGFLEGNFDPAHSLIEMEVASSLLAASAVLMFYIARMYLPAKRAVWLTLLFALATSAYSIAARAVWQHTPSMLLLTIIIYLLLRAESKPSLAGWVGLPVAIAYTCRPTDALFVFIFTLYVAVRFRKYLGWYLLGAVPVATAFITYNYSIYHSIFSPYYKTNLVGFLPSNWPRMAVALAGDLLSPSRGLLIFTPVFMFAIVVMIRGKWNSPLAPWLAALALLQWIIVASYVSNWWAGHSYGPRFFTDITPVFVLFLIPYLQDWEKLARGLRVAFLVCALIGFAIHLRGGWSEAVIQWNSYPQNVDQHPERNWDWSDPPFLRWRTVDQKTN